MALSFIEQTTGHLIREAERLGFSFQDIIPARPVPGFERFRAWIDRGHHAGMRYLSEHLQARQSPDSILPGASTVLMLAFPWDALLKTSSRASFEHLAPQPGEPYGIIASYAVGPDYHAEIRDRLKTLATQHRTLLPNERVRGVVDTAPLLEREYASLAGLGQIGKNTMLIHPHYGSRVFLAALLSTAPLRITAPSFRKPAPKKRENGDKVCPADGSCRCCLEACPTGALREDWGIDAGKCLNYWTIEHRGTIPGEIAEQLDRQLFGCERCLNSCPCHGPHIAGIRVSLQKILAMDESAFRHTFGKTPLARSGREKIQQTARLLLHASSPHIEPR